MTQSFDDETEVSTETEQQARERKIMQGQKILPADLKYLSSLASKICGFHSEQLSYCHCCNYTNYHTSKTIRGKYRFGVTEEDLQAVGANDKIREMLSFEHCGQSEINTFRIRRHIEKWGRKLGDTGSSEVQGKDT